MGNKAAIQFRQSCNDFPLTVKLGEKTPSWGLSRWNKNGLRLIPLDDEGFTLRGDRRRLIYNGRRRSHRFTILGDNAFEYDCILLREPESNVISLVMEGAEKFDFFRQPEFVPDPFLKGSYAVYKKETLLGEGTGKLCHIHRPQIIDARGRRCWGELSAVGNELRITIPEKWLSEAAYPVVVDPTIGTNTVGSLTTGKDPNNNSYDRPWLDGEFTVNKYQVPQNGNGLCTAYLYCCNNNTETYALPLLYTNVNNKPYKRKSKNEKEINVWFSSASWKSNTFNLDGDITAGDYVWYGIHASWFTTRFDYGGECYKGWFNYDGYEDYEDEPPPYIHLPDPYITSCTIKWSMYFNYTAVTSQNYVRTITQGVTLTDNRKITADYKRLAIHTVNGAAGLNSCVSFFRQCLSNASATMRVERLPVFFRSVFDLAGINEKFHHKRDISRTCVDTAAIHENVTRGRGFFRVLTENLNVADDAFFPVLFMRSISETKRVTDTVHQWAEYIRGLRDIADSMAETSRQGEFYRKEMDTVQADGPVFRSLSIFVRILTTSFVRDFILRWFLVAREELVLKSYITRDITLDSKI